MVSIVEGRSKISLRMLDWFVTKYSCENNITYKVGEREFNVYVSYKAQLKSYKKIYFDPFKRKNKFLYHYKTRDNELGSFLTTLGQLNFFRWAFENLITDYIRNNYGSISGMMNKTSRAKTVRKSIDNYVVTKNKEETGFLHLD